MLQRDRSVRKGSDIRHLLDCRLNLWNDGNFDVLLQEAEHCDCLLRNSHHSSSNSKEHIRKVYTKLMMEGNVRAAIRWITERSGGARMRIFCHLATTSLFLKIVRLPAPIFNW